MDSTLQWDLPSHVIARIVAPFSAKEAAKSSCIARSWRIAIRGDPILRRKVDLEKSWRCGDVEPFRLEIGTLKPVSVEKKENLIALGGQNQIQIWDLENKILHRTLNAGMSYAICMLGGYILSGQEGGVIFVWSISSRNVPTHFDSRTNILSAIVEVGGMVASAGVNDPLIRIWRQGTWECTRVLRGGSFISYVMLGGFQDFLFVGSENGFVQVWQVVTGERIYFLQGHGSRITCIRGKGNTILAGFADRDAIAWDLQTGEFFTEYWSPDVGATCLDISGERVALASGGILEIWDIEDDKIIRSFDIGGKIFGVWINENKITVVDVDGRIFVWDFLG